MKVKKKVKPGIIGKIAPKKNGCFGKCHREVSGIDSKLWKAFCKQRRKV